MWNHSTAFCQFVHPSIRPWMAVCGCWGRIGAGLSGFQGGVSGPPPPQAGKLRLRKERTRPLQTATYSTTASPLQSKPMSRLENLNQQRTLSNTHSYWKIWSEFWCRRVQICLLYSIQAKGLDCLEIWEDLFINQHSQPGYLTFSCSGILSLSHFSTLVPL